MRMRDAMLATILGAAGCDAPAPVVPAPDRDDFARSVYPLLLRDCAFVACHGTTERFFQVYGPGRLRLAADTDLFEAASDEEIATSYERARAMLWNDGDVRDSPLLRKPVEGGGHAGLDGEGRNVYDGRSDPDFLVLARWAEGASAPEVP
jgi:hypothetical protein